MKADGGFPAVRNTARRRDAARRGRSDSPLLEDNPQNRPVAGGARHSLTAGEPQRGPPAVLVTPAIFPIIFPAISPDIAAEHVGDHPAAVHSGDPNVPAIGVLANAAGEPPGDVSPFPQAPDGYPGIIPLDPAVEPGGDDDAVDIGHGPVQPAVDEDLPDPGSGNPPGKSGRHRQGRGSPDQDQPVSAG